MDSDRFEVTHDSGDIKSGNVTKRVITGLQHDIGPIRIEVRVDTYAPNQGKATLNLWTGVGWADAVFRHGEELVASQGRGLGFAGLDTTSIAEWMYDEVVRIFRHEEED